MTRSLWSDDVLAKRLQEAISREGERCEPATGLLDYAKTEITCTYASQLLGSDPTLTAFGGSTSTKTRNVDRFGVEIDVILMSASAAEFGTTDSTGHVLADLAMLRQIGSAEAMSATDALFEQNRAMLISPVGASRLHLTTPVHVFLQHKIVNHVVADAVLVITNQPNYADICREIWGAGCLVVPPLPLGWQLTSVLRAAFQAHPQPPDMIVMPHHGLFVFGPDVKSTYLRVIDLVDQAERFVERSARAHRSFRRNIQAPRPRQMAPILRGFLEAASAPNLLAFDDSPNVLACLNAQESVTLQMFPTLHGLSHNAIQSHVLLLDGVLDDRAIALDIQRQFTISRAPRSVEPQFVGFAPEAGGAPIVLWVPNVGIFAAAATAREAAQVKDLAVRALNVMNQASRLGRFQALPMADIQMAGIQMNRDTAGNPPSARSRIVLVTSAATEIGLATATAFLECGDHVMLADVDSRMLSTCRTRLARKYRNRVTAMTLDISDETSIRDVLDSCVDQFGGLDVLVSSVSDTERDRTFLADGLFTPNAERALQAAMATHFWGHQSICRLAANIMLAQGSGTILLDALTPSSSVKLRNVANTALLEWAKQLAGDLANDLTTPAVDPRIQVAAVVGSTANGTPAEITQLALRIAGAFRDLATLKTGTCVVLNV